MTFLGYEPTLPKSTRETDMKDQDLCRSRDSSAGVGSGAAHPYRHRARIASVWVAVFLALSWQPIRAEPCQQLQGEVISTYECTPAPKVAEAPLYLLRGAAPNLLLSLDNSRSMAQVDLENVTTDARSASSATNPLYYNPEVTYTPPPPHPDGTIFHSVDFESAPADVYRNQFCSGCEAKLNGSLAGKSCAGSPNSLCQPPDGFDPGLPGMGSNYWDCKRNLKERYAVVTREGVEPCPGPIADSNSRWLRDPTFMELLAPSPLPWQKIPTSGREWAILCMYQRVRPYPYAGSAPLPVTCPAYYYRLDRDADPMCATIPSRSSGATPWINACLKRALVGEVSDYGTTSAAALAERATLLTDCPGGTGPAALAKCNFANWFTYYRTRLLSLQTTLIRVMANLDDSVRVNYQVMSSEGTTPGDSFFRTQLLSPFYPSFDTTRRGWFYDWLMSIKADSTAALVRSAVRAHNFFMQDQAYLVDPQAEQNAESNPLRCCRNNVHLLFTDGYWDDPLGDLTVGHYVAPADGEPPVPDYSLPITNFDGAPANTALPTSGGADTYAGSLGITDYDLSDPLTRIYRDGNTASLADVVFYSWITDLRPNEHDLVAIRRPSRGYTSTPRELFWNPRNDPADWQHITTFTIGFGVTGSVRPDPSGNKVGLYTLNGSTETRNLVDHGFPDWSAIGDPDGSTEPDDEDKIDDLWHAGVNGRGGFTPTNDPQGLAKGFADVIAAVSKMAANMYAVNTAPAINSASTASTRYLFMASFETEYWTGDLRAHRISGGQGKPPCGDAVPPVPEGDFCDDPARDQKFWSAAERLRNPTFDWSGRTILTGTIAPTGGHTGVELKDYATALSVADREALVGGPEAPADPDAFVRFLRGDRTNEDDVTYRMRSDPPLSGVVLGDIINSAPTVVSAPHRNYSDNGYSGSETGFRERMADREELVYVGANDGMLHAFSAATGEERFAYVPRPIFRALRLLAEPGYGSDPRHRSFVDGPIGEGDAYIGGDWRSILVGALGMGAQGVYAIRSPDVPAAATAAEVHLWDFTDADDPDMGYVLGRPTIARVRKAGGGTKWVAILGNGVNSSEDDGHRAAGCDNPSEDSGENTCGQAVLYVVDLEKDAEGQVHAAKIYTGQGIAHDPRHGGAELDDPSTLIEEDAPKEPNGLFEPVVLGRVLTNEEGDALEGGVRVATLAYAGDLYGNLWRFDLLDLAPDQVKPATLVFSAVNTRSVPQPVMAPPTVATHPSGVGVIVLFGTGRYFAYDDPKDSAVQSFYGIWDRVRNGSGRTDAIRVAELQPQYFKETDIAVASSTGSGATATYGRTSTRAPIHWAADPASVESGESMGWRIDLGMSASETSPDAIEAKAAAREAILDIVGGERVVLAPRVRGNRVIFLSMVPDTNECAGGGKGWINALDYESGAALGYTPFDYNGDGAFDAADLLNGEPGSSVQKKGSGLLTGSGSNNDKDVYTDNKGETFVQPNYPSPRARNWRHIP